MCTTEFTTFTLFLNHHLVYCGFKIWTNALIHTLSFNRWGLIPLLGVRAGLSDSFFVKRIKWKWWCPFPRLGHERLKGFLPAFSFGSLLLRAVSCQVLETLQEPHGEARGHLLTACEWVSEPRGWHLGCNLIGNPDPEPPGYTTSKFLTDGTC